MIYINSTTESIYISKNGYFDTTYIVGGMIDGVLTIANKLSGKVHNFEFNVESFADKRYFIITDDFTAVEDGMNTYEIKLNNGSSFVLYNKGICMKDTEQIEILKLNETPDNTLVL